MLPKITQEDKYLQNPENGQQDLISSHLEILKYPGTHYALLEQENIEEIAKIIFKSLNVKVL